MINDVISNVHNLCPLLDCGYMCGYATIAVGRFAVDYGLVKGASPETTVKIQCPCGLVTAKVQYDVKSGKSGATKLESVPCFVFATNLKVNIGKYPVYLK